MDPNPLLDQEPEEVSEDDKVLRDSSDQLFSEDEESPEFERPEPAAKKPNIIKRFFKAWLGSSKKRWANFLGLLIILLGIAIIPSTRYAVLNKAGVRSAMSVRITDKETLQPLKGVTISVDEKSTKTDNDGYAVIGQLELGPAFLEVKKLGFATESRPITIGWGSNPLDDIELNPTGARYVFRVKDFLSEKPVADAAALSGDSNAQSDDGGEIILTLDNPKEKFDVEITAPGYQAKKLTINSENVEPKEIMMIPAGRHAFVSNRSGTLDLFKAEADGSNEELAFKGSANYGGNSVKLELHPHRDLAAFVSKSQDQRGSDGRLLSTLVAVDLKTNKNEPVVTSDSINLVGWTGNRLTYIYSDEAEPPDSNEKYKLASFDYSSGDNRELAAANSFNSFLMARDHVYYAPSAEYQNGINVSLFRAAPDGSDSQVVLGRQVLSLVRSAYDKLSILVSNDETATTAGQWYGYDLLDGSPPKKREAPSDFESKLFIESSGNRRSVWVDQRDGKGVLIVRDGQGGKERVIHRQEGMIRPLKWLNDTSVVYHVDTSDETADYAISINGGKPRKIKNVTAPSIPAR